MNKLPLTLILGRGRLPTPGGANIPQNELLGGRFLYIDAGSNTRPHVNKPIETMKMADLYNGYVKCIIVDLSSFYCGCIQNLQNIVDELCEVDKQIDIFVPLDKKDKTIPNDIYNQFSKAPFQINEVSGNFPLFDFNKKFRFMNKDIYADELVNPQSYIKILYKRYK